MVSYINMYTSSKKKIKMKMEITMGVYGRGMKSFPNVRSM
jgi:hypothetical protein